MTICSHCGHRRPPTGGHACGSERVSRDEARVLRDLYGTRSGAVVPSPAKPPLKTSGATPLPGRGAMPQRGKDSP